MKLPSITLLIIIAITALPITAAESKPEPLANGKHQLSHDGHLTVLLSLIAGLRAENKTLNLRVTALSQLLAANQRKDIDQKAQAAILETQKRVLSGMGLSATECLVNLDGSVDCKPDAVKVEKQQP